MAQTREKLIQELNRVGMEWYSIDEKKAPAEKKKKYMEIFEIVLKIFIPAYFDCMGTVNTSEVNTIDRKVNILYNIVIAKGLKGFDPTKSTLYGYIAFCFFKRYKGSREKWLYDFERPGSKIERDTVDISSFTYTDSDGNELDWEGCLALMDKDFDSANTTGIIAELEVSESLNKALSLMAETFMLNNSARKTKENARKMNIFQLLFSSNLVNIAKLQVPRKELQHEREVLATAKQKFFVFCYDSERTYYTSFDDLEDDPLKTNRAVYELAERRGKHYTLKESIADNPIYIPIPNNICIMYLFCIEGDDISDSMFTQYKKKYLEQLQEIRDDCSFSFDPASPCPRPQDCGDKGHRR